MRVVIAGAGNVGVFLAEDLLAASHDVLVVEKEPDIVARVEPTVGAAWVVGDACELSTLQAAALEDADVVVAATGDDEDNLVVSLLAKQEFAVPRVVARVNHPKNHWLFKPTWGVDVSVSTPHLLSALVQEAVSVGSLVRLLTFEGSSARLVEVTLADQSPAVNQSIADLELPRDATIVAVMRGGHVVVPRGDTVLGSGDEILALVTTDSEDELKTTLVGGERPVAKGDRARPGGPGGAGV
ncbi:MAG TPA: TrkA family potassium uptake protein [Acidimicrobiales bacterium]|jgi:trk system potassium uptake protein TrkA|nr:TrkA family potassium uptake protein [Acidimicrobiales bacterium]